MSASIDRLGVSPTPRIRPRDGSELLSVPGGEFVLGIEGGFTKDGPAHHALLSPFLITKFPVTNEQYARFLLEHPNYPIPAFWRQPELNQPNQPVVGVSWFDACTYCEWAGLALPSEAQWEAAARGEDQRFYCWGDDEPTRERANFRGGPGRTTPVDSYPAGVGPYGTWDQAGNVWEWCADVWDAQAYLDRDGRRDPVSRGGDATERAVRGGSWNYEERNLLAFYRGRVEATEVCKNIGFRCVLNGPFKEGRIPGEGVRRSRERGHSRRHTA